MTEINPVVPVVDDEVQIRRFLRAVSVGCEPTLRAVVPLDSSRPGAAPPDQARSCGLAHRRAAGSPDVFCRRRLVLGDVSHFDMFASARRRGDDMAAATRLSLRLIPRLTAIDDDVSVLVRGQYEENPYPRWVHAALVAKPTTIDDHLRTKFPSALFRPRGSSSGIDVLVAGCG
jgi:hypothetical protein